MTNDPYAPVPMTPNGLAVATKRYLDGETVDQMWDRVSQGRPEYRRLLQSLRFLPNSPTLFNLGRNNGCTLSACFVFDVFDCMREHEGVIREDSIVRTREKAIAVAKAGGGVGYFFGDLRPRGSLIKSVHRKACGPVAVLRDYHMIHRLVTQGGKRDLAQMGVLNYDHPDVREFIHCKDEDPQGLGSFNLSVSWTEEGVAGVRREYLPPGPTPATPQTDLWWDQCTSAWKTGCPGMLFIDQINNRRGNPNPHLGRIRGTNPCGETPNRSDEPCNLGSLSLPRYWRPDLTLTLNGKRVRGGIDWDLLGDDVRTATFFLDDILDWNVFPHPAITAAATLTRKLGLGAMGLADLQALLHVHYDTEEALGLSTILAEFIDQHATAASVELATIKGPYPGYCPTRTKGLCRRNETNTSIAPTGTIALLAGVWGSIEPYFALRCERTTGEGMKLQDGVQDWVWDRLDGFTPKVAGEIPPAWHIRHQAAWQAHVDLGVSKTINMPKSSTVKDVSDAYLMMHDLGCKGGTIFRDGCRDEQVLVARPAKTKSVFLIDPAPSANPLVTEIPEEVTAGQTPNIITVPHSAPKRRLPDEAVTIRRPFRVGGIKGYLHVGLFADGTPGEIFLRVSKMGSSMAGMLDAFAKTISIGLQHGTPLKALVRTHRDSRFEPSGPTGVKAVPICTSIPDFVARWLEWRFTGEGARAAEQYQRELAEALAGGVGQSSSPSPGFTSPQTHHPADVGMWCPDCGAFAYRSAGCLVCSSAGCGWSKCG